MLVIRCQFNPKSEFIPIIQQEMYKANVYRNQLMQRYLQRLQRYRELRIEHFPDCQPLLEQVQTLQAKFVELRKEYNGVARDQRTGHPLTAEIKSTALALKEARKALKAYLQPREKEALKKGQDEFKARFQATGASSPHAKRQARINILKQMFTEPEWPAFWKATRYLEEQYIEECAKLRKNCGLSIGTYLKVEDAHMSAIKKSESDPKYKRYRGDGFLGHQCRGAITTKMMEIIPRTDPQSVRKGWATLRFNLNKLKSPIWVEGKICLRRYTPDMPVKFVYLIMKRIGLRYDYEIQFTVDVTREQTYGEGKAGFNIGWRRLHNGDVRVGYLVDEFGHEEEITLPKKMVDMERRDQSLERANKKIYNTFLAYLAPKLKEPFRNKPEWMQERIEHCHSWKSHGRLAHLTYSWKTLHLQEIQELWQKWKDVRLNAVPKLDLCDEPDRILAWAVDNGCTVPLLFVMEVWRKKDEHLVNGYCRGRARRQRWRQDIYQCTAKRLSQKYGKLVIGPTSLKNLAEKQNKEEDTTDIQYDRSSGLRHICAPSFLKARLLTFGNVSGGDEKNISIVHFNCGGKTVSDKKKQISCKCGKCGVEFDQDRNAALHLLQQAG